MKKLSRLLLLIVGMTAAAAMAQKADSVIVIYDNQQTIIPLPVFGSQTSVSYADSNKVIEIGVWLRKPGEPSPFLQKQPNDVAARNPKNKTKWFSEVEAGYIKGFTQGGGTYGVTSLNNGVPTSTLSETYSVGDRKGYQIRLSVIEGEFYLSKKSSIISGFKLGFSQTYLQAHSFGIISDSLGNQLSSFDDNYEYRINSFQFLYQFGFSYHFNAGKLPARINIGNSMGILRTRTRTNFQETYGGLFYASLLQPFVGMEIWKMGVLFSADFALPNYHYYILHDNLGGNISVALTYRIF